MANTSCWMGCLSVFWAAMTITTFCLIGFAFDTVEVNKIALKYESISKSYEEEKVYGPGRYHAGLTGKFREYPSTWQDVTFSDQLTSDSGNIESKTKNPATIWIEISFQYKLRAKELFLLYEEFPNDDYENNIVIKSKAAIQKVPEDYLIDDFIKNRQELSFVMAKKVQEALDSSFVDITSFQMLNVYFASQFEETFVDSQVKNRQTITETERQKISELQGQVNVIESEAKKQIDKLLATKQSEGDVVYQEQFQEGRKALLQAEGTGYQTYTSLTDGLKFDKNQLMQYIWMRKVESDSTSSTTLFAGFDLNNVLNLSP